MSDHDEAIAAVWEQKDALADSTTDKDVKFVQDLKFGDDAESTDAEDFVDFSFETDHLVLRGHKDYWAVMRTIAVLQFQQQCALKQLDALAQAKTQYLEDPELFLSKLKQGEDFLPVTELQVIELPKFQKNVKEQVEQLDVLIKQEFKQPIEDNRARGKYADNKTDTFNKLWSYEEQSRLEQLLIEYPPEPVEARRYAKIAKALGTRTVQQVSSRVQKYFQKLYEAGLPVPGRKPKNRRMNLGKYRQRSYQRITTFFPHLNVPAEMPEDDFCLENDYDFIAATSTAATATTTATANDADIKTATAMSNRNIADEQRVDMLNLLQVLREEIIECAGYDGDPMAAKCAKCQRASVSSKIFYCNTCQCSISTCSNCLIDDLIDRKFTHLLHNLQSDAWNDQNN